MLFGTSLLVSLSVCRPRSHAGAQSLGLIMTTLLRDRWRRSRSIHWAALSQAGTGLGLSSAGFIMSVIGGRNVCFFGRAWRQLDRIGSKGRDFVNDEEVRELVRAFEEATILRRSSITVRIRGWR